MRKFLFYVFMVMVSVTITLAAAEVVLRLSGHVPGYTGAAPGEYLDLKRVDTLIVHQTFETDSLGIFRATHYWDSLDAGYVINRDGFRGSEFEPVDSSRKTVLLLGDSFTWGGKAEPITESFADFIAQNGWYVYNSGIPGTEPNQYARIAEHYIPLLRPDVVVINFFMGNDIMHHHWETGPYQQRYFITNAGFLNPFLEGDYLGTAEKTLEYYYKRHSVPNTSTSAFNRVCAMTVLGTKLWSALQHAGITRFEVDASIRERLDKYTREFSALPVSADYLQRIRKAASENGSRLLLMVIPVVSDLGRDIDKDHPGLFGDIPHEICPELTVQDYHPLPDGHFNNAGHRKYGEYLLRRMNARMDF